MKNLNEKFDFLKKNDILNSLIYNSILNLKIKMVY